MILNRYLKSVLGLTVEKGISVVSACSIMCFHLSHMCNSMDGKSAYEVSTSAISDIIYQLRDETARVRQSSWDESSRVGDD